MGTRKKHVQRLGVPSEGRSGSALLPDDRPELKVAGPAGTIEGFLGLLSGKAKKPATIEEINDAAAAGWASKE